MRDAKLNKAHLSFRMNLSSGLSSSVPQRTVGRGCRPKPYKFIGFGDIHGPRPYKLIGFGDVHGPKPYKFIGFHGTPQGSLRILGSGPDSTLPEAEIRASISTFRPRAGVSVAALWLG